ncbi:hypothetical protein MMC28_006751, partial [Mycoblastus sanguinarius]|nr:hypothetical protein [Mycoblastus sanguinarius]
MQLVISQLLGLGLFAAQSLAAREINSCPGPYHNCPGPYQNGTTPNNGTGPYNGTTPPYHNGTGPYKNSTTPNNNGTGIPGPGDEYGPYPPLEITCGGGSNCLGFEYPHRHQEQIRAVIELLLVLVDFLDWDRWFDNEEIIACIPDDNSEDDGICVFATATNGEGILAFEVAILLLELLESECDMCGSAPKSFLHRRHPSSHRKHAGVLVVDWMDWPM